MNLACIRAHSEKTGSNLNGIIRFLFFFLGKRKVAASSVAVSVYRSKTWVQRPREELRELVEELVREWK